MGEDKQQIPEGEGKNAAKKAARKEAKATKRAEHKVVHSTNQVKSSGDDDVSKGKYGNLPLIRSESSYPKREFVTVTELNQKLAGKVIWIRVRLHTVRARGKQCFAVLRQREATIQGIVCVGDNISKQMVKFASK